MQARITQRRSGGPSSILLPPLLLLLAAGSAAQEGTPRGSLAPVPDLVAHRGASHDAPENTLAAFRLAWEQGADAIEGDFRLTRDGAIVCIHDATTGRTASKDLDVASSTLADLRELDVGSWKGPAWKDERIPTLAEVLATVPEGKRILIEIKCGVEILPALEKVLSASRLEPAQTAIISFDAEVIAGGKKRFPGRKAFWLTAFEEEAETGRWKPSAAVVIETLERTGADGVDAQAARPFDRSFVAAIRAVGREVHVWTVNEPDEARRVRDLGVDSITTGRPGFLRGRLEGPGTGESPTRRGSGTPAGSSGRRSHASP